MYLYTDIVLIYNYWTVKFGEFNEKKLKSISKWNKDSQNMYIISIWFTIDLFILLFRQYFYIFFFMLFQFDLLLIIFCYVFVYWYCFNI